MAVRARETDARQLRKTAAELFGHSELLPGQEDAMAAVLGGHDTLLVAPTGSGKSLSYQVPGVLMEGCTVVVSPLLALQHDQIEGLAEVGEVTHSVRISSAETERQRDEALAEVAGGEARFLFLSPEQLAKPSAWPALPRSVSRPRRGRTRFSHASSTGSSGRAP